MTTLVRILEGSKSLWACDPDDRGALEKLANHVFAADEHEHSVFEVRGEFDEAHAVAAYYTALKRTSAKDMYAVRLLDVSERAAFAALSATQGHTGITPVDYWHRDVTFSDAATRIATIESVLSALHRGEDRIRYFQSFQIEASVRRFLASDTFSLTPDARTNCRRCLGATKGGPNPQVKDSVPRDGRTAPSAQSGQPSEGAVLQGVSASEGSLPLVAAGTAPREDSPVRHGALVEHAEAAPEQAAERIQQQDGVALRHADGVQANESGQLSEPQPATAKTEV
jgi:hypothetical protein